MSTKVLTIQMFILFLFSIFLIAQDDKNLNEKLSDIKGEVNKIVVSTEKGDILFVGDEAKELFKKMKSKKMHKQIKWISEDGEDIDIDGEKVMIFKSGKGDKHIIKEFDGADKVMIFKHGDHDDFDIMKDGKTIKVEVEDINGEKKVTVITKEDGEEKVETFVGKEADEYLEKMEDENEMIIDIEVDVDSDMDHVWIHKSDDKNRIEKEVKVEVKDGIKKVTVTTTEDGEKKVEVLEGDEANKYLEEVHEDDGKNVMIKKKFKDGKKYKKIIIKEIEEEEKK